MRLKYYPLLKTKSRRAIKRVTWRGKPYNYSPRGDLLTRLALQTGEDPEKVYEGLMEERAFFVKIEGS